MPDGGLLAQPPPRRRIHNLGRVREEVSAEEDGPPRFVTSGVWAGYAETVNAPYSNVTASWVIPAITGTPPGGGASVSVWVGFDGYANGTVEQCGIYIANPSAGSSTYFTWVEMAPAFENWWSSAVYPVAAGDHFTASANWDGINFHFYMADTTKGWSYSETKSLAAAQAETNTTIARSSIEVIVESATATADFGSITFTGVTAMTTPIPITLVHTGNSVTVGSLTGGSFTATWVAY